MLLKNSRLMHGNISILKLPGDRRTITFLVIFSLLVILPYVAADWDPYEVLGVQRDASLEQIKRAYRDLARKLHPDKSNTSEDDAGRRFIELNKAFNILKDPARRSRYDQHGDIDENRHARGHHGGGNGGYHRAARENWSAGHGFRTFTFTSSSFDSYYRRKSITTRQYYNEYIRESKQKPFLVFFYADICPTCSMIESTWIKLTEELAKYNIGSFTINVHRESRLVNELGVHTIPHIACLINTQVHPYYLKELSLPSFVRFIKELLPSNLMPHLYTVEDQDRHIASGPQFNRLSAIIINNEKTVRLRYLLMAYALRNYYRFGFVSTRLSDHVDLFKQYKLKSKSPLHILVFNERHKKPVLHLECEPDNFNTSQYIDRLLARPFLKLPRLSSQQKFDDLCLHGRPKSEDGSKPPLCVILFASTSPSSSTIREKMIEFMEVNELERDRKMAFVYLDPDKQSAFVQSLLDEALSKQPEFVRRSILSSIILIERHPSHGRKAHYHWIGAQWDPRLPDEIDRAKVELHQYATAYKQGLFAPSKKVALNLLIDEEGASLVERLYTRLIDSLRRVGHYLTSRESFSAMMILVGCALLTSLFLYKSPVPNHFPDRDANHEQYRTTRGTFDYPSKTQPHRGSSTSSADDGELRIIELKAETYNGMVRLLKPGYRSIILLTDQASIDKLLANFKKAVWPYRRNKTLLFGYLCLDKNLRWYRMLLEQILGREHLNVNKRNCIGTVLSLNGFKQYLRVYHAKHHEIDTYDDQTDHDGSFLGFDDGDVEQAGGLRFINQCDEKNQEVIYTVDNLLDKLPIWLDKMFDGMTKRYFLDKWPEEIN